MFNTKLFLYNLYETAKDFRAMELAMKSMALAMLAWRHSRDQDLPDAGKGYLLEVFARIAHNPDNTGTGIYSGSQRCLPTSPTAGTAGDNGYNRGDREGN